MSRETFKNEGVEYWKNFGKEQSFNLAPGYYNDLVSPETYREILSNRDLCGKKVLDIGSGYPPHSPYLTTPEPDLTSRLQEVLIKKGANIVPIDIAKAPLRQQQKLERKGVQGDMFKLPIKDESMDGVIMINVLSASFPDSAGREMFISEEEVTQILQEVYRILKNEAFAIVNDVGNTVVKINNLLMIGPPKDDTITVERIKQIAKSIGFKDIQSIPFDKQRVKEGERVMKSNIIAMLPNQIKSVVDENSIIFDKVAKGAFIMVK